MTDWTLRSLDRDGMAALYRREFRSTFPPSERKSLGTILRQMEEGSYPAWGLYQGEELAAYALLWLSPDRAVALLDYLGVPEARRGHGNGSRMLEALRRHYGADTAILAEVEAPVSRDPGERALQERRLDFYRRAGFREAGFDSYLFGVHYRMLAAGPGTQEELLAPYRALYQGHLPRFLYRKFVRIPWVPLE